MQPAHAGKLAGSSIRRRRTRPLAGSNSSDADIDPLVAHRFGSVAHHVIGAGADSLRARRSCSRAWLTSSWERAGGPNRAPKQSIPGPAPAARSSRSSISSPSFSYSSLYHSGGISSAISPSSAFVMRCSTRAQPGLERIDARDVLVDAMARIDAPQRRIGKIPLAGVEAKALVDHHAPDSASGPAR